MSVLTSDRVDSRTFGHRISSYFYRHPRTRLILVLAIPLAWFVVVYLGSLVALLVQSFYALDSFSGTVDENFTAYGLLTHRHTPEMEQEIGAQLLFTPHLAPMNRGILATCYARPASDGTTTAGLIELLRERWRDEPFMVVTDGSPSTKATLGSNAVHVTARYDARTATVVAIAALDNLAKGASGGAVQSANVALGLDETAGLTKIGVAP